MFNKAFAQLIDIEGGYSDDAGGTMWGITLQVARDNSYNGAMRDLPLSFARDVYKKCYWDKLNLDNISSLSYDIAYELFDTGVNMGIRIAARFLQRALNCLVNDESQLAVDCRIGPKTFSAFQKLINIGREPVILKMLNCQKGLRYVEIVENNPAKQDYLVGWFNKRVSV